MKYGKHWSISAEKKQEYIDKLLPQLSSLRAKAGLSQDELSGLIGVSRQTYCLTETGARGMSWNTYLSIIMFFDYNQRTHDLIRHIGVFPDELFYHFNPGENGVSSARLSETVPGMDKMYEALDEKGKSAVGAIVSTEFARCKNMSKTEYLQLLNDVVSKSR